MTDTSQLMGPLELSKQPPLDNDNDEDMAWVAEFQKNPLHYPEAPATSTEDCTPALMPTAPLTQGESVARKNPWTKFRQLFAKKSQTDPADKPTYNVAPIRVIIGFLPEVVERDALEYAVGVAEKYFDQIGLAYFDAVPYANGFAFEVHEGGAGRAFLPEIIKYFAAQGAYRSDNPATAIIKTATRMVEVQHLREGLTSIILSENTTKTQSEWLHATERMQPAIHKRTGFFVASAAIFVTGFMAMIVSSLLTRYTPYMPLPDQKIERISTTQLPKAQWQKLEHIMEKEGGVKALRFRNNKWESPELWPTSDIDNGTTAGSMLPNSNAMKDAR
ncbi:MAG: hypothetical protein Q7S87_08710 [Agitococcus sp.]|nr:hypothetical protein [Agitococcus sp.]MDO9176978.1 hypothetical protein [Agitococcus sp.]